MPWEHKQPDLKNNPLYLEPRVTAAETQLAQKANQTDVRLKAEKIGQTDVTEEFLQQMAGSTPINAVPADGTVTPAKLQYKGSLDSNRGANYPFTSVGARDSVTKPIRDVMRDAVLDVKVYGARTGKYYRIEFIDFGYVRNSTASYQIGVSEYDANNFATSSSTGQRDFVALGDILYSKPTGVVTRVITSSKIQGLAVVITYDSSVYADGTQKIINASTVDGYNWIIDPACYIYTPIKMDFTKDDIPNTANNLVKLDATGKIPAGLIPSASSQNFPFYVKKSGTNVTVAWKYNKDNDFWLTFSPVGQNNLPQFAKYDLAPNTGQFVKGDFTVTPTNITTIGSDYIGPYVVMAKTNINGDNPSSTSFTGGWHGYNGDQTGAATASNKRFDLYVNDALITSDGTYGAFKIDVVVKNGIQGCNTKKADGTGRELLLETVRYTFDYANTNAGIVKVRNNIEALEDITIQTYYGMQMSNNSYFKDKMLFTNDSTQKKWFTVTTVDVNGGNKSQSNCTEIMLTKNNNYLCMLLDNTFELGRQSNVSGTAPVAFTSLGAKSYFSLVNGISLDLNLGEITGFKGGYKFYYQEA